MCTDPGDLVIDFTCGSGTTAFVAEQWGRRWITIDTSRVALALARQRLMGAKFPFYYLADSVDGRAKEQSLTTKPLPPDPVQNDIRQGFVYERVQHITLKSLANNPDIHEGLTRAEIDAAIKKHAEFEVLYDKPYEDKSKVGGDWIVKLPDANHAAVPCNEYAMMSWASQVGIDVPEVALRTRDELPDLPAAAWPNREEVAYVISRFDHRDAGSTSVHIEDLAQVKGIYPDAKYSGNFETIAGLIYRGREIRSLQEFVRRMTFNLLVGNGDADLKNWSMICPDRRTAQLSPAYDIVLIASYFDDRNPEDLGLIFGGSKPFEEVTWRTFVAPERKLHSEAADLVGVMQQTVHRAAESWGRRPTTWTRFPRHEFGWIKISRERLDG